MDDKDVSKSYVHPLFTPPVYSDHLPVCMELPIDDKSSIKFLSYNVMGAGAKNNLTRVLEDKDMAINRYGRIAVGLKKCVDALNLDFILIQEVSSDIMCSLLSSHLGDHWVVIPNISSFPELLTCYRKDRFDHKKTDLDIRRKTLSSVFQDQITSKIIHIHNVWSEYDTFPDSTEKYYRELLMAKNAGEFSVVIGDTNSRISPLGEKCQNLVSGIIPYPFNSDYGFSEDVQLPDHPDGGFYSADHSIHQFTHRIVNIVEGSLFHETENHFGLNHAVLNIYRAVLCLDDTYQSKLFFSGKTLFEYESMLRKKFDDSQLLIRMTSTILNAKGLLLRFSPKSAIFLELQTLLQNDKRFCCIKVASGAFQYPCVLIDITALEKLEDIINKIPKREVTPLGSNSNSLYALQNNVTTGENDERKNGCTIC